ncbi:hypothetical protein HF324_20115 [Chitinophaga oryzae]|uniref:HTH luxR-type domain-containing protein n=1 Tax=Chitinophaga oryzae TaxID=2725414 RepID=A0AAE6ZJX0_9BACT|nr:LuxR C-terminal-related transcriptional regulator [Chitinophaga oryzae]QJB33518.1 hypothetical protein HF329_20240 [Chitinophaga oryzae]QJB40039.1 hypothetical protein HF324_20115 [Chitinophaga oryzae]
MNHSLKTRGIIAFVTLFSLLTASSFAQTVQDSLKRVLQQPGLTPEEQVMTRIRMGRALVDGSRKDAIASTRTALEMSRSLKDKKYEALAHSALVSLEYTAEDTALASHHLDSAFRLARESGDQLTLSSIWYRKGWLESRTGKPHEAVKSFQESLKLGKAFPGNIYETNVYYNLAAIYADWNDTETQYRYAKACLASAMSRSDPDDICNGYQAMATSFEYQFNGDTTKRELLDSALYYNRKAIGVYEANAQRISFRSMIALLALNTANLYDQFFPRTYRDTAQHYLNIALKIGKETDQQEVVASSYGMMSTFAMNDGNYNQASELLLAGLIALKTYPAPDNRLMARLMEALSDVAERKGDLPKALEYAREYSHYYAKAFDADRMAIAKKLEAQYQARQREQELVTLQEKAAFNRKLNIVYIGLIVACLVALLYLFRSYHFRLQTTIQQQQLLEKEKQDGVLQIRLKEEEAMRLQLEKQEAELQARLQAEEAARLQAEQELIQTQKEQLQKDLLAGTLQVEQKNELLETLQEKLRDKAVQPDLVKQISRMIETHKRMDKNFETTRTEFENIHPEFFRKLQEKANNSLTKLDLKHCSYISIGLSTKEIASHLGVAPKSILMSRYRIKQKLGLAKEEGLDAWLMAWRENNPLSEDAAG